MEKFEKKKSNLKHIEMQKKNTLSFGDDEYERDPDDKIKIKIKPKGNKVEKLLENYKKDIEKGKRENIDIMKKYNTIAKKAPMKENLKYNDIKHKLKLLREKGALPSEYKLNKKKSELLQKLEYTKNYIPFDDLRKWVLAQLNRNKLGTIREEQNKPFKLHLSSSKNEGIITTFTFNLYWNFSSWFDGILNVDMQVNPDSDTFLQYDEVRYDDEHILAFVKPTLEYINGGCNTGSKKEKQIKGTYYIFDVHSPRTETKNNNCGLKCIEKILGLRLSYMKTRRQYNLIKNSCISPNVIQKIYTENANAKKKLMIIDIDFNEVLDFDKFNYMLYNKAHYYVINKAQQQNYLNKKTKRGDLYWDIETRQTEKYIMISAGEKEEVKSFLLKETILCAYYRKYKSETFENLLFETNENETCCRQFIKWLTSQSKNGNYYNCVAHNCSRFDLYFLVASLKEHELKNTDIQMRGRSIIGFELCSHLFKDSCCFITDKLSNICKSYKIKSAKKTSFMYQGETMTNENLCFYKPALTFKEFMNLKNKEKEYWKLYTDYCLYDCISLAEVWSKFTAQTNKIIEIMDKRIIGKCKVQSSLTIGSCSKKTVDSLCKLPENSNNFREYKKFMNTPDKYDFMKKFKRGGISHCNKAGKHNETVTSVDIASQYPASMMYMKIPVGKSELITTGDKLKYDEKKYGFYHLKNMTFDTQYKFKPLASKKEDGTLEWKNETVSECYVDSEMIKYLKSYYGLKTFDVIKCLISNSYIEGKSLFSKYITNLYNEKARQDILKKDDKHNPAYRETIKLFLNSLTGKLVEDPSKYFGLSFVDDGEQKLNNVGISKTFKRGKINRWLVAGCMVYSYSKRLLFEYIRHLPQNSDDVIHIETDSIYFDKKLYSDFEKNIAKYKGSYPVAINSELGNVKIEVISTTPSYFLGKKFYFISDKRDVENDINGHKKTVTKGKDKMAIKGIPAKTLDDKGNEKILVDEQLYIDVYNGKTVPKTFTTLRKQFYGKTSISSHKLTRRIRPMMKYKEFF